MSTPILSPLSFYKCLSDDTRLKALMLIYLEKELCVCDLITALELSQPKVSRHLADLRKCHILLDERRGKWVYYSVNPKLPEWAMKVLELTAHNTEAYLNDSITNLNMAKQSECCS
ncbi:Arsenic resistance transcriptional regulator ArsR1 [Paraglaciecola mesophila]|uniref:Arsenic resistance transcriptional regulator ArsR1 n=1 Tax=Paraglaciecola mesophila TaxID=197222 RepID=A0A857JMG8_9ALTE|nr:metalloregulator ArsR/SmtB family transcription factor [Paraglaciecola mesophila]QHJ13269.1 Arsenic resistance transcriptional regulator ArsR1 [Paraglaciecola mesophila]